MLPHESGAFRCHTLLTVSPRPGTTVFDFVSIFIKRAIVERAGYNLDNRQLEKGSDNNTLVRLKDVTVEMRDLIIRALQAEGFGVIEAPILTIAEDDGREEMVA